MASGCRSYGNLSNSVGSRQNSKVRCYHQVEARLRVVQNGGANTGKRFYGCEKFPVNESSMDDIKDEKDKAIEELVITNYGLEEKLLKMKSKNKKLEQEKEQLRARVAAHAKGEKYAIIVVVVLWLMFAYYLALMK